MKKITCLVLTVLMIFMPAFSLCAVAETQSAQSYENAAPLVIVRGMDFGGLYVDYGTPEQQSCFKGIGLTDVASLVINTAINLKRNNLSHSIALAAVDICDDIMGSFACDENGDSVYNVGCERFFGSMAQFPEKVALAGEDKNCENGLLKGSVDRFGADKVYYFTYDFRKDPYILADELKEYIDLALAEHNTDKVNLINCSMGGVITDCYLYKYGSSALQKCVFLSSTFYGTDLTTEILQGNITVSEESLFNLLKGILNNDFLLKFLKTTGIIRTLSNVANTLIQNEKDFLFDEFLRETFGTMLSVWATVQPDKIDSCIDYVFGTSELREKYAPLIEKIHRLQNIMSRRDELIKTLPENGVEVAVIASYNSSAIPVYESSVYQTDGGLDTRWMLGGATVSKLGESLGYTGEYVSPDGCIDLKDAVFPEYTWALRDAGHVPAKYGSDSCELILSILSYDGQPTVKTLDGFSQFQAVDKETLNFIPFPGE